MGQGTLYPALKRLEKKEFLESYWNESENGMKRKFYTITDKGKKIAEESELLGECNSINSSLSERSYL